MNTEEIKEQIDIQKLLAENHKLCLERTDRELARLESQLAEAEKPKLRHGDYGPATGSECRLVLKEYGKDELRTAGPACCAATGEDQMPETVLGNIFADLKARQETLKKLDWEYGARVYTASVDENNDLLIECLSRPEFAFIRHADIPAFILNLQRLVYTAEASK